MNFFRKKVLFVVTIMTMVLCGPIGIKVYAEEEHNSDIVFGPTSQRISLKPGETYRTSVYISNPISSSRDFKYILYATPYGVSNNKYDPVFDKKTVYTQIVDWIQLDKTEGVIEPGERQDIGLTIDVPMDAPAGGQYATIMLQNMTDVNDENEGGGLSINNITAIGSIIVADVAGKTRENGEITENSIPSFLLNGSMSTVSMVKNGGNIHTDASYVLQVWPLFSDEEICTNEEAPSKEIVLPDTNKYHVETCNLPSIGIFRAKQIVKILGETSIVERTVVVCPIWLLFLIIFVIVAIIIYFVVKARARKTEERS